MFGIIFLSCVIIIIDITTSLKVHKQRELNNSNKKTEFCLKITTKHCVKWNKMKLVFLSFELLVFLLKRKSEKRATVPGYEVVLQPWPLKRVEGHEEHLRVWRKDADHPPDPSLPDALNNFYACYSSHCTEVSVSPGSCPLACLQLPSGGPCRGWTHGMQLGRVRC